MSRLDSWSRDGMKPRTSMKKAVKRRVGRPPGRKAPHRPALSARVFAEDYALINKAAEDNCRSMSEEMIWRVRQSFEWERAFGDARKVLDDAKKVTAEGLKTHWPQDRLRNLVDGLEKVQLALANEVGDAAGNYKLDFVQFTPAEAEELAAFVIKAADFLCELEAIIRAEAKP